VLDVPGPIDMATVYVQPELCRATARRVRAQEDPEIWLNPGADDDDVLAEAKRRGLNVIAACSIIGAGKRPSEY
jgi:predicted CoA-binding protein